ncbi:MAG: hypothetical protein K6E13_12160 [Lachnospiraceae bacterium]|nr:hypothetical protein [Lachnospiraceae bacterium]
MNYKKDRTGDVPFGLHDSKIKQVEFKEDTLFLHMDEIYRLDDDEKPLTGTIEFTKTDKDECSIMVFNRPFGYDGQKNFSGECISLDEYNEKYTSAEFEIVTEGYNGYDTIFQGWIWRKDEDPIFAIMNIWNMGDMIYHIK